MKDPWIKAKEDVTKAIAEVLPKLGIAKTPLGKIKLKNHIDEPPSYKMGDLACSISFPLGKIKKVSPRKIAEEIIEKIKRPRSVFLIKLAGAYVNFFLKFGEFAKAVVTEANTDSFGKGEKKKDKIMIEYSQPNPLKAFHIGHLRNTTLGESLSRIIKEAGYDVVQANLFNDVGMHVAKTIWAYKNFHDGEKPKGNLSNWIGSIYTEAVQKLNETPDKKEEVTEILKHLEAQDDKELVDLWKQFRKWSIDEFKEIYKELGANFDVDFYESDLLDRGRELTEELRKKKLAKKSKGALIVDLKKHGLPVWLLLKTDGTTLYSTQDLALAEEKFKKYKINRSVYVVGSEQRLHFQQLFKTLELMGFKQAKKCYHLAYALVSLKGGKMSSREGTAILYSELKNEMLKKAMGEIIQRNPELDQKTQRALAMKITIAAMKFSMLNVGNNKTIFFDWDTALEFEGETGPYIQYAAVRAKRILEKAKKKPALASIKFKHLNNKDEQRLIKQIGKLPSVIAESAETYQPHIIANYAYALADKFSSFYTTNPVLDAEDTEVRDARLGLVNATFKTLKKCLYLLGIEVPDRM
jgi:arginyl-tRNA synthetase